MARGSIRSRRGDAWELRIYRGVLDGRQRRSTKTVHGSRRYATAQLADFVATVRVAEARAGTVGELLDRWFEAASRWAPPTVAQTRSVIRRHLGPRLGHLPVAKLTTADIDDLYGHLLRRGGAEGRPLSAGTVHRIHVVLHRALAQAVRWDWIWINPASTASPPKYRPSEIRPPTPSQVAAVLDHVERTDPAMATFLRLAATTGARRSQLLALRWADVDLERGALSFTRALVDGPSGPVLAPTKTGRTYRVELDRRSIEVLLAHGGTQGVDLASFVFRHADGRPWLPNHVTKRFIAARIHAGVAHFRLHDLRHFHGHADARRRRSDRNRRPATEPRTSLDDAERVRACGARWRSSSRRADRRDTGRPKRDLAGRRVSVLRAASSRSSAKRVARSLRQRRVAWRAVPCG